MPLVAFDVGRWDVFRIYTLSINFLLYIRIVQSTFPNNDSCRLLFFFLSFLLFLLFFGLNFYGLAEYCIGAHARPSICA